MPRRIMFVQQKSGCGTDHGPFSIGWVTFTRSWATAHYRGEPARARAVSDGNIADVDELWISGPKRDRTDARYGPRSTPVDADARVACAAFLAGAPLPGREHG